MHLVRRLCGRRRARHVCAALACLAACLAALVLSGCSVRLGADTKVNADGSGAITLRLSADKEIQDFLATQEVEGRPIDLFGELLDTLPAGWPLEQGTDADGAKWVSTSIPFASGVELGDSAFFGQESPLAGLGLGEFELTQERGFFAVRTMFKAKLDVAAALSSLPDDSGGATGMSSVPAELLGQVFSFENRLTLPGSLGSNNADEVAGNTLIWKPGASGVIDMQAESSAIRWGSIATVLAGVAALVLLVLLISILTRRRKRVRTVEKPPWAA